jgi:hypothetical protein
LAQEVRCVRIEASKFGLITLSSLAITMRTSWQLPVEFPLCYVVLTMGTASGRVELLVWYEPIDQWLQHNITNSGT